MTKPASELGTHVKPSWAFALRGDGTESLELDIFDVVGGGFFSDGVTAKGVRQSLAANAEAKSIKVRINSKGGDVIDGLAIYQQLLDHPAKVDVQIVGIAASIASIIAMAGDTISVSPVGFVMIHDPYGVLLGGGAKELRRKADVLDQMRDTLADVYVARTSQKKADVLAWMAAETWMRPKEAKDRGFVNAILPMKNASAKASAEAFTAFNMADFDLFANVPDEVKELVEQARASAEAEAEVADPPVATEALAAINGDEGGSREPTAPIVIDTPQETVAPISAAATTTTAPQAHEKKEDDTMSEILTTIRALLNLGAGTPDSDVTAAVGRLRDLEREVVTITSAKSTEEAVGGMRAMHAKSLETDRLTSELGKVRGERDKQNFDALILNGQSARKLTPAVSDLYKKEFEQASSDGRGADVVERLKGFLNAAPIVVQQAFKQPSVAATASESQPLLWGGKSYDAMTYSQRAKLKSEDPELWAIMKQDFESRAAA